MERGHKPRDSLAREASLISTNWHPFFTNKPGLDDTIIIIIIEIAEKQEHNLKSALYF